MNENEMFKKKNPYNHFFILLSMRKRYLIVQTFFARPGDNALWAQRLTARDSFMPVNSDLSCIAAILLCAGLKSLFLSLNSFFSLFNQKIPN